jgi:hypothetical protein
MSHLRHHRSDSSNASVKDAAIVEVDSELDDVAEDASPRTLARDEERPGRRRWRGY